MVVVASVPSIDALTPWLGVPVSPRYLAVGRERRGEERRAPALSTATAMDRQLEINLLFFKIKIRFPAAAKHQCDTLSRYLCGDD